MEGSKEPGGRAMPFKQFLTSQHRACDELLTTTEQAAHRGDWAAAVKAAQTFIEATEAHLHYEEDILFPALQAAAPMTAGPVAVMRSEHTQMRELFAELRDAVGGQDATLLADVVDTLLLIMQQHNAKEENVLYPIADRTLKDDPSSSPAHSSGRG